MRTILVIDDEESIRTSVRDILEIEDYQVLSAVNGAEGITAAFAHKPDLIISDINLDDIDGFELLAELRKNPDTALIPVILITGEPSRERMRHGMNSRKNIDEELVRLEAMMDKADDGSRQASPEIPSDFGITGAYPNPFNASTTITYQLPEMGQVTIKVFNLNGREVDTLAEGAMVAGYHRFNWNGKDVSSGIYFAQIEWNGNLDRTKLVLVR